VRRNREARCWGTILSSFACDGNKRNHLWYAVKLGNLFQEMHLGEKERGGGGKKEMKGAFDILEDVTDLICNGKLLLVTARSHAPSFT